MITKITKLHGVGALHAPLPNGALSLKAKTIIYGENGRGKTTLVALLRSLCSGDTASLKQRKTIRGIYPQSAQVLVHNQPHDLSGDAWNRVHPHICIFDSTFISDNVYAGGSIDPEQRKNLLSFAIGSTGVTLAGRVDGLASAIAAKRSDESAAKENLKQHISGTLTPEQFANLPSTDDSAEAKLVAAKKQRDAVSRASTIQTLQTPSPIFFEEFNGQTFADILQTTFESVSVDASERLHAYIESSHVTRSWLEAGSRFDTGETCPYCAQDTQGNVLIEAYRVSFSETYKAFKENLRINLDSFLAILSAERARAIRTIVEGNRSKLLPWKEFISQAELPFDLEQCLAIIRGALDIISGLAERKMMNLLEPITLTATEIDSLESLDLAVTAIDDYNAQQVIINEQIVSLKSTIATANLSAAEAEVINWENRVARRHEKAVKAVMLLLEAIADRQKLEGEKDVARAALDAYTATVVGQYKNQINKHLKGCGTSFQITQLKTVYTGAKPRFDYAIELFGTPVDLANKPGSPVVFDSALSLGDKSALAFAFFLAKLENDPKRSEQIVVFDDPLSSLDSCRRRYTRIQIADLAPTISQLIVLTHEEATVADIASRLKESECCLLALMPQGDFSFFSPTSVKELTATEYARYFYTLTHYLHSVGKPEEVVKIVRPFLELNLRYRFPEEFGPEASLGQMIGQIRTSAESKSISRMNLLMPKLEEVNEYCTKHSHGDKALINAEKVLASDLKMIVLDAIEFARGLPN